MPKKKSGAKPPKSVTKKPSKKTASASKTKPVAAPKKEAKKSASTKPATRSKVPAKKAKTKTASTTKVKPVPHTARAKLPEITADQVLAALGPKGEHKSIRAIASALGHGNASDNEPVDERVRVKLRAVLKQLHADDMIVFGGNPPRGQTYARA